MDATAIQRAAFYLAEAFETGNPLAPLPEGLAPPDADTAEAVAEALLDRLGLAPCGLRVGVAPDGAPLAGPMLEARLLRDGAAIAIGTLRHGVVTAAAIGVLAESLDPGGTGAPRLAGVHPAIDVADSRFRDGAASPFACLADLAGIGLVVAGTRRAVPSGPVAVSCGEGARRTRGATIDLMETFALAADAARRHGGLPAGGLLVVTGLTAPAHPESGDTWVARLGALGQARARFVADASSTAVPA